MFLDKLKITAVLLLGLALAGIAALTLGGRVGADPAPAARGKDAGSRPAPTKAQPRPAPIVVRVTAQLYEVDDASYRKLLKSKRLSKGDLEEMERKFLDPLAGKFPVAPEGDTLFGLLKQQNLLKPGKEVEVTDGREALLLSAYKTVRCRPGPEQVRRGETAPQKIEEGVSVSGRVQVSADRRYVRCKFTEKGTEIEAIDEVPVEVGPAGKEVTADVPFLKEGSNSQMRDIPDGGSFLLPLHYRPRAARERERWLVLCVTPRIVIEEEERLRGK